MLSFSKLLCDGNGAISLDTRLDNIHEVTDTIQLDGNGYCFLIDREGNVIAHRDESQVGKNYLTDLSFDGTDKRVLTEKVLAFSETEAFQSIRLNGNKTMVFTQSVMDEWYVVLVVESVDVFGKLGAKVDVSVQIRKLRFGKRRRFGLVGKGFYQFVFRSGNTVLSYQSRKELWLAVYGASIYDMSGFPEWFRCGCFDPLPSGYYPAARVHYIKYIYIRGDALLKNQPKNEREFGGQLFLLPAICEPLISQTALDKAFVSEIHLTNMFVHSIEKQSKI